ncbi:Immunoglobulin superfamily containing leucine-rich repeat protein [Holothuria leucospilota]|uniref:Immunoglobulin superfamily containing leucine-rich repeat protein n=1 Tax=Holothuria leucospilota TaxID=206669 RepID=A0A9Q1HIS0_HOLLE|nr:Immunoglobulin superfamily containing leucine-rich repeat protein [Holothuria leucospilota]
MSKIKRASLDYVTSKHEDSPGTKNHNLCEFRHGARTNAINTDTCSCRGICFCFIVKNNCTAVCSYQDIDTVPKTIPSNVNFLVLSHNHLMEIPNRTFYNMSDLIILELDYNYLKALPADMFERNGMLKKLVLSHNHLTEIPNRTFYNTSALIKLELDYNYLKELPADLFGQDNMLKKLVLSHNHLRELPKRTFYNMSDLIIL